MNPPRCTDLDYINFLIAAQKAFTRLEVHRLKTWVSWYEAKLSIMRDAARIYLVNPIFTPTPTA